MQLIYSTAPTDRVTIVWFFSLKTALFFKWKDFNIALIKKNPTEKCHIAIVTCTQKSFHYNKDEIEKWSQFSPETNASDYLITDINIKIHNSAEEKKNLVFNNFWTEINFRFVQSELDSIFSVILFIRMYDHYKFSSRIRVQYLLDSKSFSVVVGDIFSLWKLLNNIKLKEIGEKSRVRKRKE